MHKLRLETWLSFSFLFESHRGTWVVTCKSRKNRTASNQVGNAFQTLIFNDFARDSQNRGKRLCAACFYTFQIHYVDIRELCSLWKMRPTDWDPYQTFSELMIWSTFKLWLFPAKSYSSTNKNSHFLAYEK